MGTYPCSNCGATADTATGCPQCGNTVRQEIADLDRIITRMQFRNQGMADEQALLSTRLQGAITTRSLLLSVLEDEKNVGVGPMRPVPRPRPGTAPPPPPPPPPGGRRGGPAPPTVTAGPVRPGKAAPLASGGHAPETSTGSVQNALLWLGALLFAVTGTGYLLRELDGATRVLIFTVLAAAILGAPLPLARRGLVATAEALATVGLLFVLLDGYAVWATQVLSGTGIPATAFAGVIFLGAAAVAAGYRWITHLIAPRFASLVLLQPVLPLLLASAIDSIAGWSAVLAGVGAMNLALTEVLRRRWHPAGVPAGTTRHAAEGTPYLRDAVWALHGVAVLGALTCALVALIGAGTVADALGGAAALLLTVTVGLGGGLTLRRWGTADVAAGVATAAVVLAVGRVAAVAAPGSGLVLAALAVLAAGVAARWLVRLPPAPEGRLVGPGPGIAAAGCAVVAGLVVLGQGFDAVIAPVRAASPAWHAGLGRYGSVLRSAAGPHGWALVLATLILTVAAVVLLPVGVRGDGATIGIALAALLAPAGLALPWSAAPVVLVLASLFCGGCALLAQSVASVRIRLAAALVTGAFAFWISLARPDAGALTLIMITIAGAAVGTAPRIVERRLGRYADLAAEAGWAAAAAALPGVVALAIAGTGDGRAAPVLAGGFVAVAVTLSGAAIAQVARGAPRPLPVAGAAGGALAVSVAAFVTAGLDFADIGVAALLLASAIVLCLGPALSGRMGTGRLDGTEVAALVVTAAAIAAVARVAALAAPGYGLAIAAGLVLVVALGLRAMPPRWRRGPIAGGGLVGVVVAVVAGVAAVRGALDALGAVGPVWHTDLGRWSTRLPGSFGAQVPLALLMLAIAALVVLPMPASPVACAVGIGLAVLATPAAFGLPWWSPVLFSGTAAAVTGLLGSAARVPAAAWAWAGTGTVLFADTVSASLIRPATTAGTLLAATAIFAAVAWTADRTRQAVAVDRPGRRPGWPGDATAAPRPGAGARPAGSDERLRPKPTGSDERLRPKPTGIAATGHPVRIGGLAVAGLLAALAAGAGCAAVASGADPALALTAALAGLCAGLAGAALACRRAEGYLPYVAGTVAFAGTVIAIAALPAHLPLAVYAAAAALLAVLAELLRTGAAGPLAGAVRAWPVAGRPGGSPRDAPAGQPRNVPPTGASPTGALAERPGFGLLITAGPATLLALAALAPSIVGVLVGPYQWLHSVWSGAPAGSRQALGAPGGWVGDARAVTAALLLTIAAALGAIGLGGSRLSITSRIVAVVIPGIAVTLLIAPAALRMGWPAGPVAAVLVAALAGLGLAGTPTPPETIAAQPLRKARRLVLVICLLAAGAGLAGSLATPAMTLGALAGTFAAGLLAALYGRRAGARICGWLVTAFAGHLLALVAGLAAGVPGSWSAFAVAGVAAVMLVLAALLPRLRVPQAIGEASTVEAGAYAGAVLALALAAPSPPHLAVFTCLWGAVLAVAAARPGRPRLYRTGLIWAAAAHEVVAWWLLMHIAGVRVAEAYTLAVAAAAAVIGYLEARRRPDLSSWLSYGVALVATLMPSLVIVLATGQTPVRRGLLIVAAAATVVLGALRRQQAPVVIGGVVLAVAALHELAVVSAAALLWTLMAIVGGGLVALGANFEKRRRDLARLRGALTRLR